MKLGDLYDTNELQEYLRWMNEELLSLPESLAEIMARVHRVWVRDLLWETSMSVDELATYGDFPCPSCPAKSYTNGPHKMSCIYKRKDQLKLSVKEKSDE